MFHPRSLLKHKSHSMVVCSRSSASNFSCLIEDLRRAGTPNMCVSTTADAVDIPRRPEVGSHRLAGMRDRLLCTDTWIVYSIQRQRHRMPKSQAAGEGRRLSEEGEQRGVSLGSQTILGSAAGDGNVRARILSKVRPGNGTPFYMSATRLVMSQMRQN
ncbi:hypothetical protein CONLIGDRAFT_161161 [Coniochaeta ligniaria NRRL 30616]|uniref:Uncharacterized protein n=1 Tax=Coniochaeta ligniaria NRRL 30616 TaxID=1408157 RepID=A0A1J7JUG4_9PEZI|nr:hypothetical protein CONLIGDRAFT_161161 [Coniochaeta ligniaria NRRL 30616]